MVNMEKYEQKEEGNFSLVFGNQKCKVALGTEGGPETQPCPQCT